MNLYDKQDFIPMLLGQIKEPFDDPNYLFELKFDGIRALMFLEPNKIIIKNRKNSDITYRYPDLVNIKNKIKKKVIFDGEIVLIVDGKPNFSKLMERALLKTNSTIDYYAENFPVVFVVFDILYEDNDLTNLPLIERKKILNKYPDTQNFIKSEYFLEKGKELFEFVVDNSLEGIIAKEKNSTYEINKRTQTWLKIKNILDDDFLICGYKEEKDNAVASLLIGKKIKNKISYIGSVMIGKRNPEYLTIKKLPKEKNLLIEKEGYIPLSPILECTVEYLEKTKTGKLRQPQFRGLKY